MIPKHRRLQFIPGSTLLMPNSSGLYTEIKSGNNNEPIALHTTIGWVLLGGNQSTPAFPITNKFTLDTSADNLIQKFWDIESYGTKPKDDINLMTVNDKKAMEILRKNDNQIRKSLRCRFTMERRQCSITK